MRPSCWLAGACFWAHTIVRDRTLLPSSRLSSAAAAARSTSPVGAPSGHLHADAKLQQQPRPPAVRVWLSFTGTLEPALQQPPPCRALSRPVSLLESRILATLQAQKLRKRRLQLVWAPSCSMHLFAFWRQGPHYVAQAGPQTAIFLPPFLTPER